MKIIDIFKNLHIHKWNYITLENNFIIPKKYRICSKCYEIQEYHYSNWDSSGYWAESTCDSFERDIFTEAL